MTVRDWTATLQESLTASLGIFIAFLPKLFGALMLVALGYLLARLVGFGAARLLQLVGMDRLLSRTAIQALLDRSNTKKTVSQVLGMLVFWVIFLLFLISAAEAMSFSIVSQALRDLTYYLPKVGLAVLILVLGCLPPTLSGSSSAWLVAPPASPRAPLWPRPFTLSRSFWSW